MTNDEFSPGRTENIWRFVRGDLSSVDFEDWLYTTEEMEKIIGTRLFPEAVSVNYSNPREVADLKALLIREVAAPAKCDCHLQPDVGFVALGRWPSGRLEVLERAIDGNWWRHRMKCTVCGTIWKIAAEERIYDVWLLFRNEISWPSGVQTYRGLLLAAKESGASVHYFNPQESFEIPAAIRSLAEESPGIGLSEITELLPVDARFVGQHARDMVSQYRLDINLNA